MPAEPVKPRRPRGRPPKSEGLATAQRLIDAAAAVCAEYGFDGSTLALIADRAGVHSTAVYNHFASREDLLHAAADRALRQITAVAFETAGDGRSLHAIPAAYLQPKMSQQRRLIAEIHLASGRDERLAALLFEWHQEWSEPLLEFLAPTDPNPRATLKAFYLLLLGLCHADNLPAVNAPHAAVIERAERMVEVLMPQVGSRSTTRQR